MFVSATMIKVLRKNKRKLNAIKLLIPLVEIVVLSFLWVHSEFYKKYPSLLLLAVGLQFFLLIIKMIIATVTKVCVNEKKLFIDEIRSFSISTFSVIDSNPEYGSRVPRHARLLLYFQYYFLLRSKLCGANHKSANRLPRNQVLHHNS